MNKGEWGEPCVALRLLADGRLYMADEDSQKRPDEWMSVVELIRHETEERVVKYSRDPETLKVTIDVNGELIDSLQTSDFTDAADELSDDIRTGRGTFEVSKDVDNFFQVSPDDEPVN